MNSSAAYNTSAVIQLLSLSGRKKWQPTLVLLPGEFHGWRSLAGYSPWGCKQLDTIEWLHFLSFYSFFWRGKWQPTPVFLPGESHWWRGLVDCRLWGCKESDTTKQLTHTHTSLPSSKINPACIKQFLPFPPSFQFFPGYDQSAFCMSLLVWIFPINGIIQYVTFCV